MSMIDIAGKKKKIHCLMEKVEVEANAYKNLPFLLCQW